MIIHYADVEDNDNMMLILKVWKRWKMMLPRCKQRAHQRMLFHTLTLRKWSAEWWWRWQYRSGKDFTWFPDRLVCAIFSPNSSYVWTLHVNSSNFIYLLPILVNPKFRISRTNTDFRMNCRTLVGPREASCIANVYTLKIQKNGRTQFLEAFDRVIRGREIGI